jgi:hypothetical protein
MNVWSSDVPFDPELFDQYCTRYNRCTRIYFTKAKDPKDISNQHYVTCMRQDLQEAQEYKL